MRKTTRSHDLFEPNSCSWEDDPILAFDTWLATRKGRGASADGGIKTSTAAVYRSQWNGFIRYLERAGIRHLSVVSEIQVSAFLAGLANENRNQRARIRSLIERALHDILADDAVAGVANPATLSQVAPTKNWKEVGGNRPMSFLSSAEVALLVGYLGLPPMLPTLDARWREARDRAMTAVYLGGGLKVVESLSLTINCVTSDYEWLNVRKANSQFSHRARLLPFAQELLRQWMAIREASNTLGDLVFPADVDGRPMHSVTALRASNAIAQRCGLAKIRSERTSPQTFRNTYGAHLLEQGETDLALSGALGFTELVTASRMRAAWCTWKCSVESSHQQNTLHQLAPVDND